MDDICSTSKCNKIISFKCKYPCLCNVCYEKHKLKFSNIKFEESRYAMKKVVCDNCSEPIYYKGGEKVDKQCLSNLQANEPEIYTDKINTNNCALKTCNKSLGIVGKLKTLPFAELCHKCIMKVNTLAINNFSKLTPLGQCDTCKYIDPKYKFHKECYITFWKHNGKSFDRHTSRHTSRNSKKNKRLSKKNI